MMSKAPFYTPQLSRFRDATSSNKQNEMLEQVFYDLTELFNIANLQESEIKRIRKFFEVSSHYSQEQLSDMEMELNALKEDLDAIQRPGQVYKKKIYPRAMRSDRVAETYEQALIDTQHDIVTLPYSANSTSKIHLYDEINQEYILPNTIDVDIEPKADDQFIKENSFRHALTPDEHTFWHREYTYFSGLKNHVDATITITLPDDIISNRDVNTIYIHPFPLNTLDILNVEYQLDGGWNTLPGFKSIENAGNTKLCFSPTEMSKVRITLRQRHFVKKGSRQVFHMGIREIGVAHNDYQKGVGRFEIPVEFNSAFNNKEILDIQPIYQNSETLSIHQKDTKLLTFKVYEVDENEKLHYISDTFPIQIKTQKILLKGVLAFDRNTFATPALTGVELSYKGDS